MANPGPVAASEQVEEDASELQFPKGYNSVLLSCYELQATAFQGLAFQMLKKIAKLKLFYVA